MILEAIKKEQPAFRINYLSGCKGVVRRVIGGVEQNKLLCIQLSLVLQHSIFDVLT